MLSTTYFTSVHSLVIGCSLFISTCQNTLFTPFNVPYKLSNPDETYKLSNNLNEVSGINITTGGEAVLVDDEKGSIFYYSLANKNVVRSVHFSKEDNWEDIYVTNDTVYVLKNDGILVEIQGIDSTGGKAKIRSLKTGLNAFNNTEGLCYDHKRKVFLIACKGRPGLENFSNQHRGYKAIYEFNLQTRKLNTTPAMLINIRKVESMLLGSQMNIMRRFLSLFSVPTKAVFQPSGIAIHPITGDIYIISATGHVLVLLNKEGTIKAVRKLPPKLFQQPEGIAFDESGNLFISNEERSGKGNILKFSLQQIL